MNECERYQEMICCLIDGELSKEDAEALMAHIALCPECKASYEAFSMVSAAVASDLEEVPEALHEGIMAGVRRSAVYENNKRGRDRRFKRIIAAAACFAIVVVSAVGLSRTLLERASDVAVDEEHVEAVQAPVDENGLAALPPETSADAGASAQASASPAVTVSPAPSASAAAQATEDAYLSGGQSTVSSTPSPTASPSPVPDDGEEEEITYSSGTTALGPLPTVSAAPAPAESSAEPPETASPSASDESPAQSESEAASASEADGDSSGSGEEESDAATAPARAKRWLSLFPFSPSSDAVEAEETEESAAEESLETAEAAEETTDPASESEDEKLLRAFKELFGIETEPDDASEPEAAAVYDDGDAEAVSEYEADSGETSVESETNSSAGESGEALHEPAAVYDLTELEDYAAFAQLLTCEPSETAEPDASESGEPELPDGKPDKRFAFLMKYETLELKFMVCVYGDDVYYFLCDGCSAAEEPAEPELYHAACSLAELEEFLSSYEELLLPSPDPADADGSTCPPASTPSAGDTSNISDAQSAE